MTFDVDKYPDKINLGCGWDTRDGYLNVDNMEDHHPDLIADVRSLDMLPSERYSEVLAVDVLEHLPRTDTEIALTEWFRLCRPGGLVHLQVPNARALLGRLVESDDAQVHHEVFHQMFGTQAYTGDFHHTSFTDITLIEALWGAGFEDIEIQDRDGWLLDAYARRPSGIRRGQVAVSWGIGSYARESSEAGFWRWCDARLELLIYRPSAQSAAITFAGIVVAGENCTAELHVGGPFEAKKPLTQVETPFELMAVLGHGAHRVPIVSSAPRLRADSDPRSLNFRFINYSVAESGVPEATSQTPSRLFASPN